MNIASLKSFRAEYIEKIQIWLGKCVLSGVLLATFLFIYGRLHPLEFPIGIDYESMTKVSSPLALFYTEAPEELPEKTEVKFSYLTKTPHEEMWLSLQTEDGGAPVIVLVDHPLLSSLDWPSITTERYTLYQKKVMFTSIEDFLEEVPTESLVVADPHLIYSGQLIHHENSIPLPLDLNLDEVDFLWTTYHPPRYDERGLFEFDRMVDTSHALIPDCQSVDSCPARLTWKLDLPTINELNILYLGRISVDYKLPR